MSETEVKLSNGSQLVEIAPDLQAIERTRIATLLFEKSVYMTNDYKSLLRGKNNLLVNSMVFAYSKAWNDAIKLILKENQTNVKER